MTTEPLDATENTEPLDEERNDEPLEEVEETTEPSTDSEDSEDTDSEDSEDTDSEDSEDSEQGKGNREARYRRKLRDTEAERDQLRGRVETMQRAEVERLASLRLSKPGALWAAGAELASLLDDAGDVDPGAVEQAAQAAADSLGAAAPLRRPRPDLAQGAAGGKAHGSQWAEAFKRD